MIVLGSCRVVAFAVACAHAAGLAVAADREVLPVTPPMVRPQALSTFSDRPVAITLSVSGRVVEPLTFLIRSGPKLGELGVIRRLGRNAAVVVYTPNGGAGEDSFTYAAKSVDSPVSAPAKVRISVADEPPELDFPRELDFGATTIGQPVLKEIAVRNIGGGVAFVKAGANPPWTIAGDSAYQVPAKTGIRIPVVFAPSEGGSFSGRIKLGNDPVNALIVQGRGIVPVESGVREVTIEPEARAGGTFQLPLRNLTAEERTARIRWPDFVEGPESVVLPPGGTATVDGRVPPRSPESFDGKIVVTSGPFEFSVPFRVFPPPAQIEFEPGPTLDFGVVKSGQIATRELVVRNTGGADALLRADVSEGLRLVPEADGIILGPGGEKRFEVSMDTGKAGPMEGWIHFLGSRSTGGALKVTADVSAAGAGGRDVSKFLKIPQGVPGAAVGAGGEGGGSVISDLAVGRRTTRTIEVSWTITSQAVASCRIEVRTVGVGADGKVSVDWVSWPNIPVRIEGRQGHAVFEHLRPGTAWTIRVVPVDAGNKSGPPSAMLRMTTVAAAPFPALQVLAVAVGLCGAAGLFLIWKKRRRSLVDAQDSRISDLDEPGGRI